MLDIGRGCPWIAHPDRRIARRRLAPRAAGIAEDTLGEVREVHQVLIDESVARASEPGKPVLDVGRITWFAHFAVVDHVDAGISLLADHILDRRSDARGQRFRVDRYALLPGVHHPYQIVGARQTAGVGGEEPLGAVLHAANSNRPPRSPAFAGHPHPPGTEPSSVWAIAHSTAHPCSGQRWADLIVIRSRSWSWTPQLAFAAATTTRSWPRSSRSANASVWPKARSAGARSTTASSCPACG